ncbi:hypothetical protein MNBD_GAMMA12-2721 [hydrothermal vent metagenome]|uniref:Uncharacterized protein n=1 Tax=hydrothermal vent metagenome TaxID=652676 RepID=A0A3B0Z3K9_9ZZZZ
MIRFLLATLVLLIGLSVHAVAPKSSKTIKTIGWMTGKCLVIKNSRVNFPQQITIVILEKTNRFSVGTIYKKASTAKECGALSADRRNVNDNHGNNFYLVKTGAKINLAIGVFGINRPKQLKYNLCATIEGVLFSVKRNKSLIWEGYYYLGYDIEENCSAQ